MPTKELSWQYSRNQRRHWVSDGEMYGHKFMNLFEIKARRELGKIRQSQDRHDLFYKGRNIGDSRAIKTLKLIAEEVHNLAHSKK